MKLSHSMMSIFAASALASTAVLAADKLAEGQPKAIDGIETVCNGSGIENRNDATWRGYPLRLEFTGKGGQYLGGETVTVTGNELDVSVQCQGPWVLMKLPAGSYHVAADVPDAGHKEMNVRVPARGQSVLMMSFPNAGGVITRSVSEPQVASR